MALQCPFGKARGLLLLGPRPDGSLYGQDDLDTLSAIALSLNGTIFSAIECEDEQRAVKASQDGLAARISELEAALPA